MFRTNQPVIEDAFFDREEELGRLLELVRRLEAGAPSWLAILGPRKIGKTSLILECARRSAGGRVTSNQRFATAPGNTLLPRRVTRLPRATVANASQIATVNKDDLVERVGTLPAAWMVQVEDGLRWFLHLDVAEP